MATVDIESRVHLGIWTDWSRGAILGRTVTMSHADANLLIAFTVSFIVFVAIRFWRIIYIFIH
jgi:hypothetical protein